MTTKTIEKARPFDYETDHKGGIATSVVDWGDKCPGCGKPIAKEGNPLQCVRCGQDIVRMTGGLKKFRKDAIKAAAKVKKGK